MSPQTTAASVGRCVVAEAKVMVPHGRATPEPAHPRCPASTGTILPCSDTRTYAAPRAGRQHLARDWGVELPCQQTCLQQHCSRDVPFLPAWQLGLAVGRAEARRAAQHPPGTHSPGCCWLGLAAHPLTSCWRQEPSGHQEGMPSACSTGHHTHK